MFKHLIIVFFFWIMGFWIWRSSFAHFGGEQDELRFSESRDLRILERLFYNIKVEILNNYQNIFDLLVLLKLKVFNMLIVHIGFFTWTILLYRKQERFHSNQLMTQITKCLFFVNMSHCCLCVYIFIPFSNFLKMAQQQLLFSQK